MPDDGGELTKSIATLSMAEIIRLQDRLSQELKRRFEKRLGLAFSDIVGSTGHFERFGDEAGRKLQQRHFDLAQQVLAPVGGRVVDTAGDGIFMAFPDADAAASAAIALQREISNDNLTRSREQQMQVRVGIHAGSVLTDGNHVTGDAVNLAARVAGTSAAGEIRLSREAFHDLRLPAHRLSSRPLGLVRVKGISQPVELLALAWLDASLYPDAVRIQETQQEIDLPPKDIITFGRLGEMDGAAGNDVVLTLAGDEQTRKISRWHFELRRHADGFKLRPLSDQITEVDGQSIAKGAEAPIRRGTLVRVGRAATLEFLCRSPTPVPSMDETSAVD
jgi:class 3 adenylate cyclase